MQFILKELKDEYTSQHISTLRLTVILRDNLTWFIKGSNIFLTSLINLKESLKAPAKVQEQAKQCIKTCNYKDPAI